jgi:hypothetical protein
MAQGCPSNSLIADYRFDGNGDDSTGYSPTMYLNNVSYVSDHLVLNGIYDLPISICTGYSARGTVPCFNFNAFTVSLDFYPTHWGYSSTCVQNTNILTGGTLDRWFRVRTDSSGNLALTLNNDLSVPYYLNHPFANTPLSLNQWHRVVVSVDIPNKKIITFLDGTKLEDIPLDPNFVLRNSGDNIITFTDYSNAQTFQGQVDNLKIFNYALSATEIQQLGLIDPTKWADLEFIRRIEGGALRSEVRSSVSYPNIGNNLTFIDPNNVNSIYADVTVTDLISKGDFPRALIHGFFYNDGIGDVRAEVAIGNSGSGLEARYMVGRCPDLGCSTYTPFTSGTLGTVNLGQKLTLFIGWDGTQFAFKFAGGDTFAYNPRLDGKPAPTATPPIPFKAIGTHVTSGLGGFVSALFDNVYINGNVSIPYDDFNSSDGLIDRTKWKHYNQELDQALEYVREQLTDGVYGLALRGYGSFVNNGLNLLNGQNVKELQADLTVEQLINNPTNDPNLTNPATPMAALEGDFYNAGGGNPSDQTDQTGDIKALVGIRLNVTPNGTQSVGFYNIVKCIAHDCNVPSTEYVRLYYYEDPNTVGEDLLGKPHRVSISYNNSLNKFIFGFDGRATMPAPSDFMNPLPQNLGPPNAVRMGPLARVAFFSGLLGEGYVSAQFANIATVVDTDGDGVSDSVDNCPTVYNPIVAQWVDINKQLHTNSQPDFDLDGVGDACDLCPKVANDGGPCPSTVGGGEATTTGPLIKVTFTYKGPATFLVPPNCNNVVFSSVPEIAQNCRFREPYILKIVEGDTAGYGRPGGDWILAPAPGTQSTTWTINCNPLEIFDEEEFKAKDSVQITPMYTLFFEDPGIDPATGTCAPGEICVDATQYHLFQGTMVANDVTLTKDQTKNFKTVSIDIRPLSHRNIINLQSCGYVPVAIFSAPDFDARTIKIETVKMGDARVKTVVVLKKRIPLTLDLDVNRDGLKDKVVFFDIKALNLANYTGPVCLNGETTGGISFIGCDSVTIVSQKSWNWLCGCEDGD